MRIFRGKRTRSRGAGFKAGGGCRRGQYDGVASDVAVLIRMVSEAALTDGPCSAVLYTSHVEKWIPLVQADVYLGIALQFFLYEKKSNVWLLYP